MSFSKRMTKKSKKWRGALIYLALFGVAPIASGAETRYVSTYDELKSAISAFNTNTGEDYQIVLRNDIVLTGNLPAITGNAELVGIKSGSLEIVGNGNKLDGDNAYRGFYIDSQMAGSSITVSSVDFVSCYAEGGNGGDGASGGGGGMGAGAAIYANSGNVVLKDVTASNSAIKGGDGGRILQESRSYGGGGGIGGAGGSGVVQERGAADGGGIFTDGADSKPERVAGDGGVTDIGVVDSFAHYIDKTTPVGGNSLAGGGGGASTAVGGDGGFGGGGGAGGVEGGDGGFGAGGAGGADALTAGLGGFGGGSGGYVETVTSEKFSDTQGGGTGGGGAALGAAIFVGEEANLKIAVTEDSSGAIFDGSLSVGVGGGGTAEDGQAIGKGVFLLNDLTIEVAKGGKYYISDSIGGYAGSSNVSVNAYGSYDNMSGVVKTGEGTLFLQAPDSSYTGDTTIKAGRLVASEEGAISAYSSLVVKAGEAELGANQSVKGLSGGAEALVNLNGNELAITGDADTSYAGVITGDGLLQKKGSGTLTLSGNSRLEESEGAFNTEIQSGTIRVENAGAFGKGTVYYTRTDKDDQTAAIEFGDNLDVANDIVLSGNSIPMIISGKSGTLSGMVTASNSSANAIELRLDSGSTLTISNTGVTRNDDGDIAVAKPNGVHAYALKSGNLLAKVSSYSVTTEAATLRYWNSAIGNATINNVGDNTLSFILDTDNVEDGLKFANNFILDSGNLTIGQTLLENDVTQVNTITYSGNTNGAGGLIVDIGNGATMYATGTLAHAATEIKSGTLNVVNSSESNVNLGELSSEGDGTLEVGLKNLVVNFDSGEAIFKGKVGAEGEGTTIYKEGVGKWTLDLTNDSNVKSLQVVGGSLSLGENHYDGGSYLSNDFEIELWSAGRFLHSTTSGATLVLNHLNASNVGSELEIGEKDELVLSEQNASTDIAANLVGSGWLFLDNVVGKDGNVTPWILRGDNTKWAGTIATYDNNAQLTLASMNAGSENSTINFGAYGTLNVDASTTLGALGFDNNLTINTVSGSTLTLKGLTSSSLWLDDSTLTIDGGGAVKLTEGAGQSYYGETLITNGSSLVLSGDNTEGAEYGAYRRATTLTNGGALVMDYANQGSDGTWTSLWSSDINIDGEGTIAILDNLKLLTDGKGNDSYYSGTVVLSDDINFIGEDANELTFRVANANARVQLHSAIEGSGNLSKEGAGTLVLDGIGAFDSVGVDEGILQLGTSASAINDQLGNSDVTISGGVLAGWTESLGSVKLNNGVLNMLKKGTVFLNDSDSALTMDGGTIYVNVLDADNYTNFKTADEDATVALNRGAIYVDTASDNAKLASGSKLTIVETSAGNLTADKSKLLIYDDIAGKRFVIDNDSLTGGKFDLVLKDSRFSEVATSPNEKAVGEYLDSWLDSGSMDADTNDFIGQLENEVGNNPHLLNQLTGELRLSSFKAQVQSRNLIRQTLTQNILPAPTTGVVTGALSSIRGQVYEEESDGLTGWMSALAAFGDADAHNGTSGYDFDLLGGMVGVEVGRSATNQFGFFFSYSNMQLDAGNVMGRVKLNDEQFGAYFRFSDDWGYTLATGSIGISDYDIARSICLTNYASQRYDASVDGWSGSAYLERGFNFSLPASNLQPYGGLQYTHLHSDDYKEAGSLQTLSIVSGDVDYDSLEGVLGVRWLKSAIVGSRVFDFNAYTNWTHEFLDASSNSYISLAGRSDGSIRVIGNSTGRDWIYSGVGGKIHYTDSFSVFGGANVQVNDYTTYVNGHAGMTYTW